jgi:hypothetical protein
MKSALTLKSLLIAGGISVLALGAQAGTTVKQMPEIEVEVESWWTATLSTGIESKYMFRGYDQYAIAGVAGLTPNAVRVNNSPLIWTNLEASAYGFTIGAWYGDNLVGVGGTGSAFNELDLYVDYTYSFGPVDLSVGYVGYIVPDTNATPFHEVYIGFAYTALPYVTPSVVWYQGFGQQFNQGRYLEIRLDSSIPIYKDIVTIDPYALVSYSDYAVVGRSNWNHYQLGVAVNWQINSIISVFGGINYSGPLDIVASGGAFGTPSYYNNSDVWGGGGISFTF